MTTKDRQQKTTERQQQTKTNNILITKQSYFQAGISIITFLTPGWDELLLRGVPLQHQLWWTQCPKLCSLPSGHLTFICASNSFFCFRSYAHVKVSRTVFVKIHSSFHFRIMVRGGAMATVVGGMTNASHLLIFQVFQLFFYISI